MSIKSDKWIRRMAEQAAWITGSNLDINGGHHMGW